VPSAWDWTQQEALLLFVPADHSRPAMHSVGQPLAGEHDLVFAVGERPYQFSSHCRIPAQTVRAAARQYLATGELPTCVTWEPEPTPPFHQALA
jgi:hypothetical protein